MDEWGIRVSEAMGRTIAQLRGDAGLTLEELAARAGLHRTSISLVERGERHVTVASAAAIARALGISLSDLALRAEQAADQVAPSPSKGDG